MALRRDYSLTKDIDFEKNEDIVYSLYDKCEVSYIQGQYYKEMIKEYVTLYKGICGKGEDIDKLFNLLSQYASITVTDPDYTFVDEADNLRDAYFSLTEYNKVIDKVNEELSRMIDGWLASVNPKAITSQQRQQELRLIGQSEQILNRRFFVYESLLLLNALTQGSLTEGYPEEEKNPDSAYGFINLPMMTHIPLIDDLDGAELAYNPLTQVLYNMVALNSYIPTFMCHDYDNGNVCVRLWRREQDGYVPFYTSVDKSEIYVNKIGYAKQKTIWPGIIEAAFDDFGFPESKEEIVEAILGPDTSKYDMEYLCGGNNRPVENWTKELTETIRSYRKCLYDIYSSFLLTNSFVEEDELPYAKLQYAVKECMDIISNCLGQTLQQAQGAMQALSDLMEEYRESVASRASSATVKKRLSVCDTAETLLKLFNSDSAFHLQPHLYFEVFLAERIAKIIISSGKKELTREEINKKKKLILTDSVFRQEVSKMNIHILANANDKMAESVLAKMERRS